MAEPTAEQVAAYKAAVEGEPAAEPAADAPPAEPEKPEPFVYTYADKAAAEAGIAEKDATIDRLKAEAQEQYERAAQYEAMLAQGQNPGAPPQQDYQLLPDGQTPIYTLDQLQGYVDSGQISEVQLGIIWGDQQAQIRAYEVEQRLEQRLSQYEPMRQHSAAQQTLDGTKTLLGANAEQLFHDNYQVVDSLISGDPSFYLDPKLGAQRLAQAVKSAEYDRREGTTPAAAPRQAGEPVHVEGGSGAQPTPVAGTPQADDNEDLKAAFRRPVKEDGFGRLPAWAGRRE
jgi:hypothetical protein